ncbi:MAG: zinc dependent phospholipase C family protein [Terriglobales bacterium]
MRHVIGTLLVLVLLVFTFPQACSAYSILTHEQIVDLAWDEQIKPLLLQKYPGATDEDLRVAHSYAYGGSLIQDIGYYPFGNRFFSDLVHYVRSGDFVQALLSEATDVNEYAFALGALSHYAADIAGHPSVNAAVAQRFPKLRAKYGSRVTFAEDKKAHIQTEFGFDVVQVAKQRYTSDSYHNFIGFQVSKPVLERAFLKTYGIELKDVFNSVDLSIGTFRRSISSVIPEMTRVALLLKKDELVREDPTFAKRKFIYNLRRTDYEKEWGKGYQKPGPGARVIAVLFRLVPKIGPFKAIGFKMPSPETETLYLKSINATAAQYGIYLRDLKAGKLSLANTDFDTGKPTVAGEYGLTDEAYAKLLNKLADRKFAGITPELRTNILDFYSTTSIPVFAKKEPEDWNKALSNIALLKLTVPEATAVKTQEAPPQSDDRAPR